MLKEALDRLLDLARPEEIVVAGLPFIRGDYQKPPSTHPAPLEFATLSALVTFVTSNRDELDLTATTLVVDDERHAHLCGVPDPYGRRPVFAQAKAQVPDIPFGKFIDREEFHIVLLSRFVPGVEREELLRLVGNVEAGETRTVKDDGVSQEVVVQSNVAMKAREIVRPLFKLAPFSSFIEVDQVDRPFIFRLLEGPNGLKCALFEADGGAWRNVARERVAAFLRQNLSDVKVDVLW